jgi:hypothetical protein
MLLLRAAHHDDTLAVGLERVQPYVHGRANLTRGIAVMCRRQRDNDDMARPSASIPDVNGTRSVGAAPLDRMDTTMLEYVTVPSPTQYS